ncbi:transposase [Paenibacillus sp. JX-17]|uniref:Transposase n=1 Tax=Paenibacillus lacisoli TaxID=3064525 RepID=A0ABT9CBL2_9BACL|nr:transposase [Paenibacillus sp. JX-17]MDO7906647.1 transposase [Paenibacillus sp. JX-17]
MSRESKEMYPVSGEKVEVDGVYTDEAGHEEHLHRGQHFPSDVVLGTTEWKLQEYMYDTNPTGQTDPDLIPKKNDADKAGKVTHPRRHLETGDR